MATLSANSDPERNRLIGEIFRLHERRFLLLLRLMGLSREDAEDVLTQAIINVMKSPSLKIPLDPEGMKAYVWVCCRNVANDFRTKQGRCGVLTPAMQGLLASSDNPVVSVMRTEFKKKFNEELQKLPPGEQVCIAAELEGLPANEIATKTGHTVKTVHTYLSKARKTLRKTMFPEAQKGAFGE